MLKILEKVEFKSDENKMKSASKRLEDLKKKRRKKYKQWL